MNLDNKLNRKEITMSEQREIKKVSELFQQGILTTAKLPADNPLEVPMGKLSIPLIEHDYAAKTPVMWNAVYREFDIAAANVMAVGQTANIPEIFTAFRQDENYVGGGAGVGFKDEVVKHLDELDSLTREIGAVNIIQKTPEGKLRGYNTDGLGFAKSLEECFIAKGESLAGKRVLLLGSGGTANAIAFALVKEGVRLVILNRSINKAEALAKRLNEYFNLEIGQFVFYGGEEEILERVITADAIVNVSTKGATGDFEQFSALASAKLPANAVNISENREKSDEVFNKIAKETIICDIILRTDNTPFLAEAKKRGFKTLDGVPMVVYQGVEAFWLIHGEELDKKNITKMEVAKIMKQAAGLN